ncbi:MAG: FG-GAP repeat protein [Phycisphaerales bacterium]|nr:FG-GAP repeat protein [Phycisphaerales bacterium]
MELNHPRFAKTRWAGWYLLPACVLGLVLAISCTTNINPGGGGNVNDNDSTSPTRDEVLSLKQNFPTSGKGTITIQYSVLAPASVTAYYVQVKEAVAGAERIGDPVEFAKNLPAGANLQVSLDHTALAVGYYQIGLYIDRTSGRSEVVSSGFLVIEAPPNPIFKSPVENTSIHQGDIVAVSFDNQKVPATRVRWRLFYQRYDIRDNDRDGVINALDQCPATPTDEQGSVDASGCGASQLAAGTDFDGDLVPNAADSCPSTEGGLAVDQAGCSSQQLGTQLAVGEGNEDEVSWDTTGVTVGNYRLGISASDNGESIETNFTQDSSRIVTRFNAAIVSIDTAPPPPTPPTLAFTKPLKDVGTFLTETVTLEFQTTIRNAGAVGKVDIFLDPDTAPGSGNEILLLDDADASVTTASFSTANLAEGIYNVGGTVDDDVSPPVTVYAAGRVDVVKTPALTVTAPDTPLSVRPGASVEVAWTTNVPSHAGLLDVYARRIGSNGEPEGGFITIRPAGPPLSGSDTDSFVPTESGVFRVFVRVDFNDDSVETMTKASPKDLRVTTLPAIVWLGLFGEDDPQIEGAILGGSNFEDNIGADLKVVPDLNGDDVDELLVSARYAKPGFKNSSGVGEGEAYLIYGGARLIGEYSANQTGKDLLGITFTGVRTRGEPANREQTQGLASIAVIEDLDGDELPELVFGFPRTKSRGHNVDVLQDGLTRDSSLISLERADQFLRGGIVIVSSKNTNLRFPDDDRLSPVIRLDLVGQQFEDNSPAFGGVEEFAFADFRSHNPCLDLETPCMCPEDPDTGEEEACQDYCGDVKCSELCEAMGFPDDTCFGDCLCPQPDGLYDAMSPQGEATGFVGPLADNWFERYFLPFGCDQNWDCTNPCVGNLAWPVPVCNYVYDPMTCPDPLHQNDACRTGGCYPFKPVFADVGLPGLTGFYPTWIVVDEDRNDPIEPFGCRIVGLSTYGGLNDGDHFGASMTISNSNGVGPSELIVTAPDRRKAVPTLAMGGMPPTCKEKGVDGEVNNMLDTSGDGCPDPIDFPGIAYMVNFEIENRSGQRRPYNFWEDDVLGRIPPKPHQYQVGTLSHCDSIETRIENPEALRIIGQANERLRNILGINDYNGDGRNDIAAGNPDSNGGKGHLYVAYRREKRLEGDYVLGKLALAQNDPNRLDGIFVTWGGNDAAAFGSALCTDVDFNGDGLSDIVVGAPNASVKTDVEGQTASKVGSVVIIFSDPALVTPLGGVAVPELLRTGRAVRIDGNFLDVSGNLGFNVASAGDVDNDGKNDLLIAAPGATPRFDVTPTDSSDVLTEPGLDLNFDGKRDDVAKDHSLANFDNTMTQAGVVYVISGANDFSKVTGGELSVRNLGSERLRGMIIAGRRALDFVGGGDAGDTVMGGNGVKASRGRSFGLTTAGDIDGDGKSDIALGSVLADPRRDRITGEGVRNGGEVYIIYGGTLPGM